MAGSEGRIVVVVTSEIAVFAVQENHCEKTQTNSVSLLVDVYKV